MYFKAVQIHVIKGHIMQELIINNRECAHPLNICQIDPQLYLHCTNDSTTCIKLGANKNSIYRGNHNTHTTINRDYTHLLWRRQVLMRPWAWSCISSSLLVSRGSPNHYYAHLIYPRVVEPMVISQSKHEMQTSHALFHLRASDRKKTDGGFITFFFVCCAVHSPSACIICKSWPKFKRWWRVVGRKSTTKRIVQD